MFPRHRGPSDALGSKRLELKFNVHREVREHIAGVQKLHGGDVTATVARRARNDVVAHFESHGRVENVAFLPWRKELGPGPS